jgi:hypothetical protein
MPSVSLYVRRKDDRYQKCSPKAVYVLGTKFVLRYELQSQGSMPSAEITFYKPTSHSQSR